MILVDIIAIIYQVLTCVKQWAKFHIHYFHGTQYGCYCLEFTGN